MKIFPGDHGQSSISGIDYVSLVERDKYRGSDTSTSFIEGQKADGMALWDNAFEQCTNGFHTDTSFISFPSIPSSSIGNIFEQEHNVLGNLLDSKNVLTRQAGSSQSHQTDWQVLSTNFYHIYQLHPLGLFIFLD